MTLIAPKELNTAQGEIRRRKRGRFVLWLEESAEIGSLRRGEIELWRDWVIWIQATAGGGGKFGEGRRSELVGKSQGMAVQASTFLHELPSLRHESFRGCRRFRSGTFLKQVAGDAFGLGAINVTQKTTFRHRSRLAEKSNRNGPRIL